MTCPNCGHHVPEQRRFHRRSRPQTLYKRVWNKAKHRGFALHEYVRANVAAYHAGLRHDPDALELTPQRPRHD